MAVFVPLSKIRSAFFLLPLWAAFSLSGTACLEDVKPVKKQSEDSSGKSEDDSEGGSNSKEETKPSEGSSDLQPKTTGTSSAVTPGTSSTPLLPTTSGTPSKEAENTTTPEPETTTSTKEEEKTTSTKEEVTTTSTKDENTTTTTKSSAPDKTTQEPETCESKGGMCVSNAPSGWDGPIRIHKSSVGSPERCSLPFLSDRGRFHSELRPGAASCGCDCDPKINTFECLRDLKANEGNARYWMYADSNCMTAKHPNTPSGPVHTTSRCKGKPKDQWDFIEGQEFGLEMHIKFAPPPVISEKASCTPHDKIVKNEDYKWASTTRICEYTEPNKFAGLCQPKQDCVENKHLSELCIVRQGEHSCPNDDWPFRQVLFEDKVQDNRECLGCTCGNGTGECADRFWFGGCSDEPDFEIKKGECVYITGRKLFQEHQHGPVINAQCPATPGTLSGEVKPTSPWTICCVSS